MKKTIVLNITLCILICALIIFFEMSFDHDVVSAVLLIIYFSIPLGMTALTVLEIVFTNKNQWLIHLINVAKFDIFLILALLSLIAEGLKALNFTIVINLNEIIAGLATLVALDRVLIYMKIAFEKRPIEKTKKNPHKYVAKRNNVGAIIDKHTTFKV